MRVNRRRILIGGMIALGMAGLIWGVVYFASPHEPSYQGKTLSEWIAPFCRQTAKGLDAPGGPQHFEELEPVRHAVRQIGTNAIPFLIARLNHRESALHRTARQLSEKQPNAALRLTDPNVSKIRAIRALANLGRDARPAIPSLKVQVADATLSEHAVYTLSGMSPEGMRALIEQYTNVPTALRGRIATTLVFPGSVYRGEKPTYIDYNENESAAALIEGFCQVVQDPSFGLYVPAMLRLGDYGPFASNAVPVVMHILYTSRIPATRQTAIRTLGRIRSQPDVVVPALSNLLSDPDPQIVMAAASALRAFGYDAPMRSQVVRPIWPLAPGRTNQIRYY